MEKKKNNIELPKQDPSTDSTNLNCVMLECEMDTAFTAKDAFLATNKHFTMTKQNTNNI